MQQMAIKFQRRTTAGKKVAAILHTRGDSRDVRPSQRKAYFLFTDGDQAARKEITIENSFGNVWPPFCLVQLMKISLEDSFKKIQTVEYFHGLLPSPLSYIRNEQSET